uniref:Secreted protein n=1 Tax=Ascaris lumbricoides TaxID=6252 RepID=A0A0M3HJH1_ASCLU
MKTSTVRCSSRLASWNICDDSKFTASLLQRSLSRAFRYTMQYTSVYSRRSTQLKYVRFSHAMPVVKIFSFVRSLHVVSVIFEHVPRGYI